MKKLKELADVNTFFFADESKFSENNGDPENAIYYFIVGCLLERLHDVRKAFEQTLVGFRVDAFHSTDLFKEKSPKEELIHSLTNLIVEYKLECYCFKYHKDSIYESAKNAFAHLNARPEIDFNNQEFQALFFLIQAFDSYLSSNKKLIQEK